MGRDISWSSRAAMVIAAPVIVGCQAGGRPTPLGFSQTPPTVQAAYADQYRSDPVRGVVRDTRGGQDYYTVRFTDPAGVDHDVVYNEAGNEIDKH